MKAVIFDIKRFAIHDGPGIRTTVFFKGCPLSCPWCHNPESRVEGIECYEQVDRIGEREFVSIRRLGKQYTAEELLEEVMKDEVFYKSSNGGITCSGGEPLLQPIFLSHFLELCQRKGLHTALDTSGYTSREKLERISRSVDLFLYDIKHLDPDVHRKYTGVDNGMVLRNFEWLLNSGKEIIARIPVVPGFNAEKEDMNRMAAFLKPLIGSGFREVHLLPYHRNGCAKYQKFGIRETMKFQEPSNEAINKYSRVFRDAGFTTKIGG